ncbi:hypothetical protein BEI02_15060 [Elizabethkingia sp. HvH-WGS333]|uniref:hypothetical protein n=1 Tax=Elizabethkingia TaxID=308865 RepID=UPI0007416F2B|nr:MULTISPECIES: hypothetical protein [Elizabethkingia]KUG13400.1 hypothetical protein AMC91_03090 [Elizabethkingia miricola]MCL1655426.1 fibrobacter succinogenes major paralogous domain-containing protein [Elizabethkingia miricola]MCP1252853.1 fibrobacter succinogenes major paralogous domain-containing protein [Elizabethkingia sp. S0634]OIK46450.1 hypothetical protein BEI02_15060 [Elizabethkingia sp. HvH-WGS333]
MKYFNKATLVFLILFFLINSCRSAGSDNTENITDPPFNAGNASVFFNLTGTEFSESDGNNLQASTGKQLRNPQAAETYYTLINPSTLLAAEVSEESSIPLKTTAGINPVAADPGGALANGKKFRAIAYQASDGSYVGYKDFIVDTPSTSGGLKLTVGTPYNIVVYSYGTNSLPGFVSSESQSFTSATHNYNSITDGFLYWKTQTSFTPNMGDNTLKNIILTHRIAGVTVKVNSGTINNTSYIDNITSATLKNHNRTTIFNIRFGNVVGSRGNPQAVPVIFNPNIQNSATEWISDQLFVNADSGGNKTISFQGDVKIGADTKTIKAENAFIIKPGFRTIYKINLKETKCGAMVDGVFREFMCYNLGADTTADAFTPSVAIQGAKYQWGRNTMIPQSNDIGYANRDNATTTANGWHSSINNNFSYDPCTIENNRYRVPTSIEWQKVINGNPITEASKLGPWNYNNPSILQNEHYDSALRIGNLVLPLAGYRQRLSDGTIRSVYRGVAGMYWSSSPYSDPQVQNSLYYVISSNVGHNVVLSTTRITGMSIRCIKKLDTEN